MPVTRLLYALLIGLVLGGITHIASVLGVPLMAQRTAYDRVATLPEGRFTVLPDDRPGADVLPFRDPSFVTAVCRYDLSGGPVAVRAELPSSYGALAVHNHYGQPFYALTDRAATTGAVEVMILDSSDVAAAGLEESPEGRLALRIVSPTTTGFVLVRLFATGATSRQALNAIARKASCGRAASRNVSP